jgi:hypothetical protein
VHVDFKRLRRGTRSATSIHPGCTRTLPHLDLSPYYNCSSAISSTCDHQRRSSAAGDNSSSTTCNHKSAGYNGSTTHASGEFDAMANSHT